MYVIKVKSVVNSKKLFLEGSHQHFDGNLELILMRQLLVATLYKKHKIYVYIMQSVIVIYVLKAFKTFITDTKAVWNLTKKSRNASTAVVPIIYSSNDNSKF